MRAAGRGATDSAGVSHSARAALCAWLEQRRAEIEQAVITRIYGISGRTDSDPVYAEGLRESVTVALDYALEAIERGEEQAPPPPPALRAQARMAARNGIGLDIVLRRYVAGYTLLGEFLEREEGRRGAPEGDSPVRRLLPGRAALLDRLLAAVSEEYEREAASHDQSSDARRAKRVERLLAGEPLDTSQIDYEFGGWHTGVIAAGRGAVDELRDLSASVDCRLLLLNRDELTTWAWLGARRGIDPVRLEAHHASGADGCVTLAAGEPAKGVEGWRITHRQAAAALPIALRRGVPFVHYADVVLLASILNDDLAASSLCELFLTPLQDNRDKGQTLRETLGAYLDSAHHVTSTAAALGVSRRTVTNRVRSIEESLGRTVRSVSAELRIALQLHDLHRANRAGSRCEKSASPNASDWDSAAASRTEG